MIQSTETKIRGVKRKRGSEEICGTPRLQYIFKEDNRALWGKGQRETEALDYTNATPSASVALSRPWATPEPTTGGTLAGGSADAWVLAPAWYWHFFALASYQGVGGNDCASRWGHWPRAQSPSGLSREGTASDGERTVPGFVLWGLERPQEPRGTYEGEILGIVPCPRRSAIQRRKEPPKSPNLSLEWAEMTGREKETLRVAGGELAVCPHSLCPSSLHKNFRRGDPSVLLKVAKFQGEGAAFPASGPATFKLHALKQVYFSQPRCSYL